MHAASILARPLLSVHVPLDCTVPDFDRYRGDGSWEREETGWWWCGGLRQRVGMGGRDGGGERETHTHTRADRQRQGGEERDRSRQTDRQRQTKTDRQRRKRERGQRVGERGEGERRGLSLIHI